jgi:hypothetical protein
MFKRAIELLGTVFSSDLFIRAIPVFAILGGLIIFGGSYWVFPQATYPAWHDATKSIGQAVLVSGVVSAILSSLTYIGIFQKAVHDVVYSLAYLRVRKDLPELWNRVTSAISQDKFPTLAQQLYPRILGKYLPSDKNFYYSRYDRECIVDWDDQPANIIKLTETIDLTLVPSSPGEKVEYKYACHTDSRTPHAISKLIINSLYIDGMRHDVVLEEKEYDDELGGKGWHSSYNIPLAGKSEYRIRRVLTRRLCLLHDPVMEYGSLQFIGSTTVKVRCEAPELRVVFVSVGSDEFEESRLGPDDPWTIQKELKGALLPNQGYIVFIQHV